METQNTPEKLIADEEVVEALKSRDERRVGHSKNIIVRYIEL